MKFIRTIVRPTLALLSPEHRRKGALLLPLLLFQSLLDVLSAASLAPLALLIIRPESISRNLVLAKVYATFSFHDNRTFAFAIVGGIAVFFLVKHAINVLISRLKANYAFDVSAFLSQKMIDHFIQLPYVEYHNLRSSQEQVKIAHLPISFANNILLALATLITEGLILLLLVISLMIYDWRSIFFLMIVIIPSIFFYRVIRKRLNGINQSLKTNYPGLIHHLLRLFENFVEINLYQKKEFFIKQIQRINREFHQTQILQTILQTNSFRLFETTAAIGLCLLIFYALINQLSPDVTVILLGLYTAAGFRAVPSLNRIFVSILQIKSNEHVLAGLSKFKGTTDGPALQLPVSFTETFSLNKISFGYPKKTLILSDADLTIRKGERIALIGASGSGKTTLLLIIMRFINENAGHISADGQPLGEAHVQAWRHQLAYVPQQPIILDASLVENIAFGIDPKEANLEKITELLMQLDLGSWLKQLPDGLNTHFGERGIKLSGGQRQRLAIARALYSDAAFLLLDEATSQVDAVTEKEVLQALRTISNQNKTLIMVTHRQTSVQFFDRVLEMKSGKILEVIIENRTV